MNSDEAVRAARTATVASDTTSAVTIGSQFTGVIDEVRLWSVALDSASVVRDYQRYLVGNEAGLEAYYTFDYSVADQFYDLSYTGTKYHMNHGTVESATLSDAEIPTPPAAGLQELYLERRLLHPARPALRRQWYDLHDHPAPGHSPV